MDECRRRRRAAGPLRAGRAAEGSPPRDPFQGGGLPPNAAAVPNTDSRTVSERTNSPRVEGKECMRARAGPRAHGRAQTPKGDAWLHRGTGRAPSGWPDFRPGLNPKRGSRPPGPSMPSVHPKSWPEHRAQRSESARIRIPEPSEAGPRPVTRSPRRNRPRLGSRWEGLGSCRLSGRPAGRAGRCLLWGIAGHEPRRPSTRGQARAARATPLPAEHGPRERCSRALRVVRVAAAAAARRARPRQGGALHRLRPRACSGRTA